MHFPMFLVDKRGREMISILFLCLLGKLIILFDLQHFEMVDDGCVIHPSSSWVTEFLPEIGLRAFTPLLDNVLHLLGCKKSRP